MTSYRYAVEMNALKKNRPMVEVPFEMPVTQTEKAACFPTYGWVPKIAVRFERKGKVLPYCVGNCTDKMFVGAEFIPTSSMEPTMPVTRNTTTGRFQKVEPAPAPRGRGRPAGLTFKDKLAIIADYNGARYLVDTCAYQGQAQRKLRKLASVPYFRGSFTVAPADAVRTDGDFGALIQSVTSRNLRVALAAAR